MWYYIVMSITELKEKISPILKTYGIKKASVFGSVSRGDDRPDSDVDLLIERGPGPMGMFKYMELVEKLENKLGRKVDLVSEGYVVKYFEPYIRKDLKQIYEG